MPITPLSKEEYEIKKKEEDVGFFESALAGVATGLWNIPKGVLSLGAELYDLAADVNTAKEVEKWFDDVNPFDDEAEARTIGKITQALTQIGIDSAVALSKASTLANAEGAAAQLAFPLVPGIGTIARVLSYTSTALSVASNIVRAKQLLSGGGGGGSASGGGGSAPSPTGGGAPAQFNVVGNSGVNQLADVMNTQQQTPVKAYVVPSDVTTGQSLDRNIIRNASLG